MWIMLLPVLGKAQLVTISGNVIHSKSGKALENVNIFESFSNIGTITNEDGFFKLVLSQGELNLNITDNGFKDLSKQLVLKGDTILTVELEPEIQNRNRPKKQERLHADAKASKKFLGQRRLK